MRVSIVTVSLNQRPFLERALLSVLDQDYPDIEYVVVDGGSTDGSLDLLEGYRERLAAVIAEPDEGPADALNKGFGTSTGEICAYVNADDALLPGAVSGAVQWFEQHPAADVVYGHGTIVDSAGRPIRRFRSTRYGRRRHVYGAAHVMQQSTFFRRAAFDAVGGFNVENRTNWDAELLLDLLMAGRRFVLADAYWSMFTIHAKSITGSQQLAREYQATRARLFEKAMGRAPGRFDRFVMSIAPIVKWATNPGAAASRLRDAVHVRGVPT